jgi:WD40 repeat protein
MQLLTSADGNVIELAFAPDGRALAAIVSNLTPFLWDIPATAAPKVLAEYRSSHTHDITFSPDASVAGWLANQKRMEFDRTTGGERELQLTEHPRERLNAQALTGPDARLVVRTIENHVGFRFRCFIPDGTGEWEPGWVMRPERTISGWLIAGTATDRFFTWEAAVEYDRGSQRLIARSAATGEVEAATAVPIPTVAGLAARADGSEAVAFNGSTLVVWRPGEKPKKVRAGTRAHFRAVAYHPSGNYLLAANNDTAIRVFDTSSWTVVKQYGWSVGQLSAVAVSPDGTLAAAGGEKGQVVVWDFDL